MYKFIKPQQFDDIISKLVSVIKDGKESQKEVFVPFCNKLNEKSIFSIKPENYITRTQEDIWISQLKRENILLLTGKPRVGKSNTAKWIASEFQSLGYSILLTQYIDEAERFLLDPVNSPRLVVLDDPLGGVHPAKKPHETLMTLKKLITSLRQNRRLIVSQGQERLLEITDADILNDAALGSNYWIDLSILPPVFLLNHWNSLKDEYSISEPIFSIVREAIEKKEIYIEPGCLTYLGIEHEKISTYTDINKILRFARKDAKDLGVALKEEGCKDVMMGLAIVTSHLEQVQEKELAFALINKEPRIYGYSDISCFITAFGSIQHHNSYDFPDYQNPPELLQKDLDSLELLELRRIVGYDDENHLTFTHPFYRSAAESLFKFNVRRSFSRIEEILNSGIFCLSPVTARASARNLHWIYERINRESDKKRIRELAIYGLNSSYPSVRDICFEFLIDTVLSKNKEYIDELPKWINKVNGDNLTSLEWLDGQPWYPMGNNLRIESSLFSSCDTNYAMKILNKINSDIPVVLSSKDAYVVLTYLENKPEELTNIAISRILSINEGLIRTLAVKVWMKVDRENDIQILDRIFSDRHPAVAESIFKTTIRSWRKFSTERQNYIFDGLKKLAVHPVLVNAIIDDLVVFERPHLMGENPPWEIFSTLLPIALCSLPPSATLNYGRLDNVVEEAIKILPSESILPIINAWITFLEKIAAKKIPDSYALCVTDILFRITESNDNARTELIRRLLSLNGTGPLVRVLSDVIDYWDDLTKAEKDIIIELIISDRKDKYWLQSAILISREAPNELLELFVDSHLGNGLTVENILNLKPELLTKAFKMYIGNPPPLWSIGTHHREEKIWPEVIDSIARMPSHLLFQIAFNELLHKGNIKQLCSVINSIDKEYIKEVFDWVLRYYIDSNPEFMPEVWGALFDSASDNETCSIWIERIASESLYIFNDLYQARRLVPDKYLNEFYSYFINNDLLIIKKIKIIVDLKNKHSEELDKCLMAEFKPIIEEIFDNSAPLHYSTCDYIRNLLQKLGFSGDEIGFVQKRRDKLIEKLTEKNTYDELEEITDWYF